MRTSFRTMTMLAIGWLATGAVLAQEAPLTGAGPDQDQANNERYWGIANNTNNAYKTWPSSLRDPAFDRYAVRHGRRTGSTDAPAAPPKTVAPTTSAAPAAPVAQATPADTTTAKASADAH